MLPLLAFISRQYNRKKENIRISDKFLGEKQLLDDGVLYHATSFLSMAISRRFGAHSVIILDLVPIEATHAFRACSYFWLVSCGHFEYARRNVMCEFG